MPFTGVAALISGSKNTEYIVSGLAVNSKCFLQDVTICADKIHKMFDFVRFGPICPLHFCLLLFARAGQGIAAERLHGGFVLKAGNVQLVPHFAGQNFR